MEQEIEPIQTVKNINRFYGRFQEKLMSEYSLRTIDLDIILFLGNAKEQNTQKDIMKLHMFTKGHISQSLKRLSEKSYVKEVTDVSDHRVHHFILTKQAEDLLKEIRRQRKDLMDIMFENISDEEMICMEKIFQKIRRNIEVYEEIRLNRERR